MLLPSIQCCDRVFSGRSDQAAPLHLELRITIFFSLGSKTHSNYRDFATTAKTHNVADRFSLIAFVGPGEESKKGWWGAWFV